MLAYISGELFGYRVLWTKYTRYIISIEPSLERNKAALCESMHEPDMICFEQELSCYRRAILCPDEHCSTRKWFGRYPVWFHQYSVI